MMNRNRNKKVGCHCEENFSSTKQSSTLVSNQCFDYICTIGKKVEDCRVGVSHLLAMTKIGRSLEFFRFSRKNRDDLSFSTPAALIPILTLAAVLSTGIISESWAACTYKDTNGEKIDEKGNHCGTCGDDCHWVLENHKLTVTGSGDMNHYSYYTNEDDNRTYSTAPWGKYETSIYSVDVSGISEIGSCGFCHLSELQNIKFGDSITKIGNYGIAWNKNLSNIFLPDSLTTLGYIALRGQQLLSITIPATLTNVGKGALGDYIAYLQNMKINCLGTEQECEQLRTRLAGYQHYGYDYSVSTLDLSGNLKTAGYQECVSTNYFWDGAECVRQPDVSKRKCCDSCKDMGGYCNRIRYTPADAAKVLHNDNTNTVTITFKK